MNKFILSRNKANTDFKVNNLEVGNLFLSFNGIVHDFRNADGEGYIFLGDCINPKAIRPDKVLTPEEEPKGNYYIFKVRNHQVSVKSSGFAMLPIFYIANSGLISSSIQVIIKSTPQPYKLNKKWVVNQLLFNYQFSDDTIYENIKLLPAFSRLIANNSSLKIEKVLNIYDYFSKKPLKWQKQLEPLSEKFIEVCKQYLPAEKFSISFTGGFDGRTLVSIASFLDKEFTTFSYGRKNNDDVFIPQKNAAKLGIPYLWIPLEEEYSKTHYEQSALDFIDLTDGGNGFLYAHVNHAAKIMGSHYKYTVSGIAGSELFRAVHISGAVTSHTLIKLFTLESFDEFKKYIFNSNSLKYIDQGEYASAIESVILDCWNYKGNLPLNLSKNQKIYVFVFEEIFRKFFGSWLLAQSDSLIVRTPFLDFEFFTSLIKTNLAGVYSDFMTENPLKRYKGQVFYSEVIRQTNKKLFWMKTGKGYPPAYVRYSLLRPLLLLPFVLKRVKRKIKKTNFDNLSIISGLQWFLQSMDVLYLNKKNDYKVLIKDAAKLNNYSREDIRDVILNMLSIFAFLKNLKHEK